MSDLTTITNEIRQARDEIRLKIHLGSMDLQDEWSVLEKRWQSFEAQARLRNSAQDIGTAVQLLGSELKTAYQRLNKAL